MNEYNIQVKASGYCTCLYEAMMQSPLLLGIYRDPVDQWEPASTFACGMTESTHTFWELLCAMVYNRQC